ncbi:MAG: BamA/TamA family outer membrane protein [Nitrospirota bacterium]
MPIWLLKDTSEYVYGIIAPSVTYNAQTGTSFDFRYLGYPTPDKNYRIFISRSTEVDQEYTAEYWDNKFLDGKFRLYARLSFFRDSQYRFFGLGPQSREADETDYSDVEFTPAFKLGYRLPHNFELSYGETLRWVTIRPGTVNSLPYIQDRFPKLQGIDGGAAIERRLTLSYDTRDDEVFPSRGWYANAFEELLQSFTHDRVFTRTGGDVRKFYTLDDDKRFITVVKAAVEVTGGRNIPFWEESTIGGENTLRGFGDYRYRDNNFILLNLEERIRLFRWHLFGVWSEWEAAPFVDVGKVFSSFRKDFFEDYQFNPGIGFRAIVQPNIVGRVDIGYGHDGLAAFVGLDFPF